MPEDKWTYLLLGLVIGVPLGVIIYKHFIEPKQEEPTQQVFGANYAYDEQGRLTQYMPVPLPQTQ